MAYSLDIAELFNKRHDTVAKEIRKLIDTSRTLDGLSIILSSYKDKQGNSTPAYLLDEATTILLIGGFMSKGHLQKKLKCIRAFAEPVTQPELFGIHIFECLGLHEIGATKDITEELKTMHKYSPERKLLYFSAVNKPSTFKSELHDRYVKKSVGGGWFQLTDKDLEKIIELCS
jgi:hypothetical protein